MAAETKTSVAARFANRAYVSAADFSTLIDSYQDASDVLFAVASAAQNGSKGMVYVSGSSNVTFVSGAAVGLRLLNTDTTAAAVGQLGLSVFPSGGIIIWSGAVGAVPAGWYLCDGTNGTPDLRDRFIIGAGSTYAVNDTGGSANAIVVSHTHDAGVTDPGHTHVQGVGGSGTTYQRYSSGDSSISSSGNTGSATTGISVSVSAAGSSGTNANLPPYYALAFIMKA